ncbi:MAG: VOC family protein [Steroidobacteraceae bacterium]
MLFGIHHVALSTPDIARLITFYTELLGFEVAYEGGWAAGWEASDRMLEAKGTACKMAMLRSGTAFLELFEFSSPPPRPANPQRTAVDHGYTHIGLNVRDIEAEYERLKNGGMYFAAPPARLNEIIQAAYGRDPDGNIIELLEISDPAWPFHFDQRELRQRV